MVYLGSLFYVSIAHDRTHSSHETWPAFNSDAVYLYSTRDEPGPTDKKSSVLPPNVAEAPLETRDSRDGDESQGVVEEDEDGTMEVDELLGESETNDDMQADEPDGNDSGRRATDAHADVSVIYPRKRFSGHCNVETVKDGKRVA